MFEWLSHYEICYNLQRILLYTGGIYGLEFFLGKLPQTFAS